MAVPDDPWCGKTYKGFKLIKRLGYGGFGVVYEAVVVAESQSSYSTRFKVDDRFAIKVISKSTLKVRKHADRMRHEINIHLKLNHPSILKFYNHFVEDDDVFLILELCRNGDLKRLLKNRKEPFAEEFARDCFKQALQGVKYLHEQGIIHRDLKPENLLFDDKMKIKICDFGMAVESMHENEKHYTKCGTHGYMPPEIANGVQYGSEVDVFSLGSVLYYFVIGKSLDKISEKGTTFPGVDKANILEFPSECALSSNVKDLIQRMLWKNQEERIKVLGIFDHPFMLDINLSKTGNSRMADSGISSLKTLSGSNTFSSRKLHSEEVVRSGNATQNSQNMHARSEDFIAAKKHNPVPRFGKSQPVRLNKHDCGNKARPIDALKEKIQVLPSLKTGFSNHSLNDGPESHHSTVCQKETNEVSNSCHRHQQIDHCQQQNLHSHAVRDCECNSRCGDVHNTKGCCGTSQHSSHRTDANGICSRLCQGCKNTCCTEGEHCQLPNCRNEARTDSNHCHHSVSSAPCTHSSRDNCVDNNCRQQGTICSHFGHCLTSHCVHQKSCACKQESYVNHESCTRDCQQKNKICHTLNHKNPAVLDSCNVRSTAEPECDCPVHPQLPGTSKRPTILNTKHLKPRCNAYKFHRYSILDEGDVCVETFDKKEKKYVINVYIISSDGMEVSFYKFRRRHKVKLKDMPPAIPENCGHPQTFAYEDMPSQHWGVYSRASTYVAYVKAITPRVLIYSSEAKAILFQSMVNYEVTFYRGDGHKGGKFVKRSGGMDFIDGVDKIPVVGLNAVNLSDNHQRMLTHAFELERKCRRMSDFVESDCDGFFPVYIGSKPAKFCTSLKSNDKENIVLTSAMHPTLSLFNGVSVIGARSQGNPLMSLENRSVPLETLGSSSNILKQKTSRNGYDSSSGIIMRETKKGHFSFNVRDKTLSAKFHDGTGYEQQLDSECFWFYKQLGKKGRQYEFESPGIPSYVAEKVKDVYDVMKKHFASQM